MKIVTIVDEDFVNYKKASMYIAFPYCSFKCGKNLCQNSVFANSPLVDISYENIVNRYLTNQYTDAIVFAGLEPFDSKEDILNLIGEFRKYTDDDIVIYTGYYEYEIEDIIKEIYKNRYKNIIIKFGRYIPNKLSIFDDLIGVKLASNNQYAKQIS